MLLELTNITKSYGAELILKDVSLSVQPQDRIGLLGANGAGKSTLLDIITGQQGCDAGAVSLAKGARIGYLKQHGALEDGNTIAQEVASVFREVYALGEELERLRAQLAAQPAGEAHDRLLARYDARNAAFEAQEGYTLGVKINTVLGGMGFGGYDRAQPVKNLSGGEKTRLGIAKLLLQSPQLLVLDEPTNHLDFETLGWLEEYLRGYKGALLVVSHDRYFLDNVAGDICEIERHTLTRYKGGYSQFVRLKEERLARQQKEYDKQQQEIAKLEEYVAKNIVRATTSAMAKSRVHMLEHMQRVEKPPGQGRAAKLRFTAASEPYKDVLRAEGVGVRVGEGPGEKQLCQDICLSIQRGERVALIGQNGVGKSSLLKALQGLLPHTGRVQWGANVKISYFEQENRQLHPARTVIDELRARFPRKGDTELRTLLGSLLLSGDDIFKLIGDLSGGERAKVAFALIVLEQANVLILDEPTNHLDYKTKEVLDRALSEFEGTLLMVSHDRYLLNRVPTRILEMFPDRLEGYEGGYDYYAAHRRAPAAGQAPKRGKEAADNPYYRSKAQRSELVRKKGRLDALEREIAGLEGEAAALEQSLQSPALAADYQKLEECCQRLEACRALIGRRTDEWLLLTQELEG